MATNLPLSDKEWQEFSDLLIKSARDSFREVILQVIKDFKDGQKAQAEESAEDSA